MLKKKSLLLTFIIGVLSSYCAFAQQTATAVVDGPGWKRIAYVHGAQGRGFGRITIYTSGGNFTPQMTSVNWFHDWTTRAGISVYSDSQSSLYWSAFRTTDDGTDSYIEVNFSTAISPLTLLLDEYGLGLTTLYSSTLPNGGGDIRASTNTGRINIENKFVVAYNGNIGIGTATPRAKLAVEGNILAKEVKVKTDISVPDYVFRDDYKLSSLKDLEIYVRQHKHLPEIPSAADVKRDGLDLAGMNLSLLKKVEELTLHLIEMKKENNIQKALQLKQQNDIEVLKSKWNTINNNKN